MNNSKYLCWMQPIAGVDIAQGNLQSTSRMISYIQLNEAICAILHQRSAIVPLPSNIPLPSITCCYLCHLFPQPYSQDIKSWWQARALPFRAAKCKLGSERAGRSVFLPPQMSALSVQHKRRHSRQLYWKCYTLACPCSCSEKLCALTFPCHSAESKVPNSRVKCNSCLLQCCTELQSQTGNISQSLKVFQWQRAGRAASILPAEPSTRGGKRGPSPQLAPSLLIHSPLSTSSWPLAAGPSGSSQATTNSSGGAAQWHALLPSIRGAQQLLLPSSLSCSVSCWAVVKDHSLHTGAEPAAQGNSLLTPRLKMLEAVLNYTFMEAT